jgi:hypothetical protein
MPLLRIRWMCLPPASNNPTSFDVNDKRNSRLALQLQLLLALSRLSTAPPSQTMIVRKSYRTIKNSPTGTTEYLPVGDR